MINPEGLSYRISDFDIHLNFELWHLTLLLTISGGFRRWSHRNKHSLKNLNSMVVTNAESVQEDALFP
jgi:hypothetical protein